MWDIRRDGLPPTPRVPPLDYQGVMLHGPGCFAPIGVTQERFEAARQSPLDEELVRRKLRYFEAEHPDIVRTLKNRRGRTECYALVRALFRGLRARTAKEEPDPGANYELSARWGRVLRDTPDLISRFVAELMRMDSDEALSLIHI